jgi:hypothetical protein
MMLLSEIVTNKTVMLPAAQEWARTTVGRNPPKTDAVSTVVSMAMLTSARGEEDNEALEELGEAMEEHTAPMDLIDFICGDRFVDNQDEIDRDNGGVPGFPDVSPGSTG